jgi:hypothetical protein
MLCWKFWKGSFWSSFNPHIMASPLKMGNQIHSKLGALQQWLIPGLWGHRHSLPCMTGVLWNTEEVNTCCKSRRYNSLSDKWAVLGVLGAGCSKDFGDFHYICDPEIYFIMYFNLWKISLSIDVALLIGQLNMPEIHFASGTLGFLHHRVHQNYAQ